MQKLRRRIPELDEVFYHPERAGQFVSSLAAAEIKLIAITQEADTTQAAEKLFSWWETFTAALENQQEGTTAIEYFASFILRMEPHLQKIGSRLHQLAQAYPQQSHLYTRFVDEIHLWLVSEKLITWQAELPVGIFKPKQPETMR